MVGLVRVEIGVGMMMTMTRTIPAGGTVSVLSRAFLCARMNVSIESHSGLAVSSNTSSKQMERFHTR
jgi:hypothetical protein